MGVGNISDISGDDCWAHTTPHRPCLPLPGGGGAEWQPVILLLTHHFFLASNPPIPPPPPVIVTVATKPWPAPHLWLPATNLSCLVA